MHDVLDVFERQVAEGGVVTVVVILADDVADLELREVRRGRW